MTPEPPLPAGKVGDGRGRPLQGGELRSEWRVTAVALAKEEKRRSAKRGDGEAPKGSGRWVPSGQPDEQWTTVPIVVD